MIDELHRMRGYLQRGIAIAHEIDKRLETPSTGRMVVAARVLLGEASIVEQQIMNAQVAPPVPVLPAPAPEELPPETEILVGDEVVFTVGSLERRGVVKFTSFHAVDGEVLHGDSACGAWRVPAKECRLVREWAKRGEAKK